MSKIPFVLINVSDISKSFYVKSKVNENDIIKGVTEKCQNIPHNESKNIFSKHTIANVEVVSFDTQTFRQSALFHPDNLLIDKDDFSTQRRTDFGNNNFYIY